MKRIRNMTMIALIAAMACSQAFAVSGQNVVAGLQNPTAASETECKMALPLATPAVQKNTAVFEVELDGNLVNLTTKTGYISNAFASGKMAKADAVPEQTVLLFVQAADQVAEAGRKTAQEHVHSYQTEVVAATCTKDGYTLHTCACGDNYQDQAVKALGHDYGEWKITKQATTSAAGSKERVCSRCGAKETKAIAKLTTPKAASAAGDFATLQAKYPTGSHWYGPYTIGWRADGCYGFLLQIAYEWSGEVAPVSWTSIRSKATLSSLQTGDIIVGTKHSIMVTAVHGDSITFVHSNWKYHRGQENDIVRWNEGTTVAGLKAGNYIGGFKFILRR